MSGIKPEFIDRCKCCLQEIGSKNMWSEYYSDGEREIYGEMITDCFALAWEQPSRDTGVELICESCVSRLRDAFRFKKDILRTEQLLLSEQLKNVGDDPIKHEDESELKIETEYLSLEYFEDDDNENNEIDIQMGSILTRPRDESIVNRKEKRYTGEDLEKCVEAVRSKKLSQNKASLLYNVPRKTISAALAREPNKIDRRKVNHKRKSEIENNVTPKQKSTPSQSLLREELKKHGDNIATLLINTNATPIRCQNDFGYMCCFCSEAFINPADLKQHTLKNHARDEKKNFIRGKHVRSYLVKLDITGLKCKLCSGFIENLEEMMHHLKNHGEIIHFDINNHIVPFKFDGQELKCVVCNMVFDKFKILLEHMNRHSKNYVCDVCGSGYVNRITFDLHYKSHIQGSFSCDHCSKVFGTKTKKRYHELVVHIHLQKTSKCGFCGEKFSTRRKKEKHMSNVHGVAERGLKCQVCSKICPTKSALTIHTKRDHLQERRYACELCDMKFFGNQELKNHMLKHTGVKEFQCDVCKKSYGKKWTLREHMRIHADDRRYKCEHCAMAFIQRCSLITHIKTKHDRKN